MQMQGTPQSGRPAALFVSLTRSVCRSFPQGLSTDYRGWQKHQRRLPIDRNLIARIRSLVIHVIFAGVTVAATFSTHHPASRHSARPTTSPATVRRSCPLRLAGGAGRDSSQLASPNGFRPTNLARNYEAANQWKNQPDPQTGIQILCRHVHLVIPTPFLLVARFKNASLSLGANNSSDRYYPRT
jgi:hypothetical protein